MNGEMVIPVQSRVEVPKPQELLVGRIDHEGNDERHSQQSLRLRFSMPSGLKDSEVCKKGHVNKLCLVQPYGD